MPYSAQDAFETDNPVANPITPDILRARANSNSRKDVAVLPCELCPPALSPRMRSKVSESDLECFNYSYCQNGETRWNDTRELSHRYFLLVIPNFFLL